MKRERKNDEEAKPLQKWFDSLRRKHTNHMDKKGNLTRPYKPATKKIIPKKQAV